MTTFHPKEVTFVGHSLGGLAAEMLAQKFNRKAQSYNAARLPSLSVAKNTQNITCHLVDGDVVSCYPNHPGKKVYHNCKYKGLFGAHKLGNFMP
jgi:pimeloyl-ACP methyl ester carboxylesterase